MTPTRLTSITEARLRFLRDGQASDAVAPYIVRSWERCLAAGQNPQRSVSFDQVSAAAMRRATDESHLLLEAAKPILQSLHRTMQSTRYFAVLTNRDGTVIATDGPIDHSDRRYTSIARVGVDLSEHSVGTTAIGAALRELQPVRLHRGEHFFDDNAVYSCAGAPLFGVHGECIGMLDLTGVMVNERPELTHLVARSTRAINDALVRALPHTLKLSLAWPEVESFQYEEGLIALDSEGVIVGANVAAGKMIGEIAQSHGHTHISDVLAMRWTDLFSPTYENVWHEVPLWSGLIMRVRASRARIGANASVATHCASLRDVELEMIRRAVTEARGNVELAAKKLGISRATVYRKLNQKLKH